VGLVWLRQLRAHLLLALAGEVAVLHQVLVELVELVVGETVALTLVLAETEQLTLEVVVVEQSSALALAVMVALVLLFSESL
jgi:hypothetical protein